MPINAKPLPKISTLIKGSWSAFRAEPKKFIMLSLVSMLPTAFFTVEIAAFTEFNLAQVLPLPVTMLLVILMILSAPFLVYLALWGSAAFIVAALNPEGQSANQAFLSSKKYIGPLLLLGIIEALAVLGGLVLLVIPGLILAMWFTYATFIVVDEDLRGFKALERSRAYVTGRFWRTLWALLPLIGLILIASIIMGLVSLVTGLPYDAIGPLSNVVVMPLMILYCAILYKHVKAQAILSETNTLPEVKQPSRSIKAAFYFGCIALPLIFVAGVIVGVVSNTQV